MNSNAFRNQTSPIHTILGRLDEIEANVSQRGKKVERFLTKIKKNLNGDAQSSWLKGCQFILTGGSSEGTAVKENSDFDVIVILPPPFTMDHFEAVPVGSISGVYKLRYCQVNPEGNSINANRSEDFSQAGFLFEGAFIPYEGEEEAEEEVEEADDRSPKYSIPDVLNVFLNNDSFLRVEDLKKAIFSRIIDVLTNLQLSEPTVKYIINEFPSSMKITIRAPCGYDIRIDLVPQIGVTHESLPHCHWNTDLPSIISEYFYMCDFHACFKLSYPSWLVDKTSQTLAVEVTFSQLELHCVKSSENVRNSVRLAKAISKHYSWTNMGLLSYHIKRTAISLYDQLFDYNPFVGCRMILDQLANMLEGNKIDGVIIKDQDIMIKDAATGYSLAQRIRQFNQSANEGNILLTLTEYI